MATTNAAIEPIKSLQVPNPGADFQIVQRRIPTPGAGQVPIKIKACVVCHSDVLTKQGQWSGIECPAFQDTKLPAFSIN